MVQSRVRDIPLLRFKKQRVAIDGHNWAYIGMAVATKVVTEKTDVGASDPDREEILLEWFTSALHLVSLFLTHGVTPVFIFDGIHLEEKAATQEKRKQDKIKDRERAKELQDELRSLSPFDRDPHKIQELRKLLSRCTYIQEEEMDRLKDLLSGIGIPVIQARGDAEQLCSSLAREGLVSAVYSEDTDNLVYGCPLLITGMGESYASHSGNRFYRKVRCVLLSDILEELEMSHEEFIDFCIMCGCDFNTRIYRLGPKTAYKLLKEHRSIDNLPPKYDLTPLQHTRCREIFQHTSPLNLDEEEIHPEMLKLEHGTLLQGGEEILSEYNLPGFYSRLRWLFQGIEEGDGGVYTPPKRKSIKIR